jgi:hypothetical protein
VLHAEFHRWILSLPWVVERPQTPGLPGIRTVAIACEPLGVRRVWLVTGLPGGRPVAVVVPTSLAEQWELDGVTRTIAPMPADHVLVGTRRDADDTEIERVVLEAYGTSLS